MFQEATRPLPTMIPIVSTSPHCCYGAAAVFTSPLRSTVRGGLRYGRGHATDAAHRGFDSRPNTRVPPWMASSSGLFEVGHQSLTSMIDIATTVAHSGLLVRGGGGVAAAAVPLGAMLLVTACVSAVLERRTKAGAVVGAPLLSFGTFCILSNLNVVPSTHAVYDLCWSFLLPLSLSIIILGNPVIAGRNEQHPEPGVSEGLGAVVGSSSLGTMGPMGRVGLSFLIGAVGSVAGVVASFWLATISGTGIEGGIFALPRETAARIAGAVAATYVGGSVNLFAVASAVGLMGATSAGGASLLGALAAADIFLMALYFSGLVAAHKTPFLRRVFPSSPAAPGSLPVDLSAAPLPGKEAAEQPVNGAATPKERGWLSLSSTAATTLALLSLGSVVCLSGNAVAARSPLPGTSTMAVTLLTVGVARALARFAPAFQASLARTGPLVASVLLNAFFGSVGASGRWAQVVGVAPAIFAFASVALAVHIAVMTAGAAAMNRCCGAELSIDDMIVASNANIGGPSTSATFAGLIGEDELVVPAAVWGTVGYAIATTLGVGVWVVLR